MCTRNEWTTTSSVSTNDVLPVMASEIALTNSREHLNEVKCRATTSKDILYCLRSTITLDQHAHFSSLSIRVLMSSQTSFPFPKKKKRKKNIRPLVLDDPPMIGYSHFSSRVSHLPSDLMPPRIVTPNFIAVSPLGR